MFTRQLIKNRLIWIYAICKSILLSPAVVKELFQYLYLQFAVHKSILVDIVAKPSAFTYYLT